MPPLRMAVNLSGHHIRQANFIDHIEEILKDTGIAFNALEIEMTENSVMGHVNDSIMALTDLKIRGISLAIDDFGTGYSSLSYLQHFPVNTLKIDKSFVASINVNKGGTSIVDAIVAMAQGLNLNLIAEGVETDPQLDYLRSLGCAEIQGWLFGKAESEQVTRKMLERKRDGETIRASEVAYKNEPLANEGGNVR